MRAALRELEAICNATAQTTDHDGSSSNNSSSNKKTSARTAQQARAHCVAQLSPYRQAEYYCVDCIDLLRRSLHEVDELQRALVTAKVTAMTPAASPVALSISDDDDGGNNSRRRGRAHAAVSERSVLLHELARARLTARRAYYSLQKLHNNAQRQAHAVSCAAAAAAASSSSSSSSAHTRVLQHSSNNSNVDGTNDDCAEAVASAYRALCVHVARAKAWYRDVFQLQATSSVYDKDDGDSDGDEEDDASGTACVRRAQQNTTTTTTATVAVRVAADGDERQSLLQPLTTTTTTKAHHHRNNVNDDDECDVDDDNNDAARRRAAQRVREKDEFVQFMQSVRHRDDLMDAALDRIAAGVSRLRDNAVHMNNELTVQAALLHTTEQRVEANVAQLHGVNRRLRHALRELHASTLCSYVACLLVLLCVLCVLLRVAAM